MATIINNTLRNKKTCYFCQVLSRSGQTLSRDFFDPDQTNILIIRTPSAFHDDATLEQDEFLLGTSAPLLSDFGYNRSKNTVALVLHGRWLESHDCRHWVCQCLSASWTFHRSFYQV